MEQVGNELAGFSLGRGKGEIQVRAWGFWSAEVADQFLKEVLGAIRAQGRGIRLTMDATALKPMRTQGQDALLEVFVQACRFGSTVKIVTESPLMKLQLLRIVRDAGKGLPISVTEAAAS